MNKAKAIKIALDCMEVCRKYNMKLNLAGFNPNAEIKAHEIETAMQVLAEPEQMTLIKDVEP